MPSYHRLGQIPPKRHLQFRSEKTGSLYVEESIGADGFSGNYSLLYHLSLPPQMRSVEPYKVVQLTAWDPGGHRLHYLRTNLLPAGGDPIDGRIPLLFNDDVQISIAIPTEPQNYFYKNGMCDELLFVHNGSGVLATIFGLLPFRAGDYLYIPRGTIYQLRMVDNVGRILVIEANGQIDTPKRYRNEHGQLLEHAPYSERDFRKPEQLEIHEESRDGGFQIRAKIDHTIYCYQVDHHPFDVIGWDGYLYPYAFNIHDFEPRAARFHLPPPMHQTFEGPGFVVCSFVPRKLEWDPNAIPIPYYHSNIDSDEVLYYVAGSYGARKVEHGGITFHPRGIPHGPSSGAIEVSLGRPRETDELAVMVDTFRPLKLTTICADIDDPQYIRSWDT